MPNTYFIGDTHFGHSKLAMGGFRNTSKRPVFPSAQVHDEWLIDLWNSTVNKRDVVYHLGDVATNKASLLRCVPKLNGIKHLILGNHDLFSVELLREAGFKWRILGAMKYGGDGLVLTHVPVHQTQVEYRWKLNVHGHIHDAGKYPEITEDDRYFNVNLCATGGLTHLDTILQRMPR